MKILVINNNVFYQKDGGLYVFKTSGEFAVELKELGNEVEMLQTIILGKSDIHAFNVLGNGVKITAISRFNSKILTYIKAYIVAVWRIMHNDMIYIFYPSTYEYLAIFCLLLGKKYGINIRHQERVYSKKSKFLFKNAKVIFTVSPEYTQYVNSIGGYAFDKMPTISYNYQEIIKDREYNSNKEILNIIFVGRILKDKGLIELLYALKKLNLGKHKFQLKIVGSGEDFNEIVSTSNTLGLGDKVEFLGAINNPQYLKELYINSDIYILPSYHEGFPRTIYEAMMFGTPIITTFVGGISSIMIDKYNCCEILPKSIDSIYQSLSSAHANYPEFTKYASNAIIDISKILDPGKFSHAQALNNVLNGK